MDKPKYWVKNIIKIVTQWLGLSIFDLNFGSNMEKPKYWVKNGQTQWVKNLIKKCNPMAGFVHI